MKPLGKNVVIERQKTAKKTQGGILLPDSSQEGTLKTGKIIYVGEDSKLKTGEDCYFTPYGSEEVNFEGKDYVIIHEDNVKAYLK